jgi:uncharacterized membrane protein
MPAIVSFRRQHQIRTALWPIPILCVLGGVAASIVTTALDSGRLLSENFVRNPDAALAILGAIAGSMITLTGLVLTIVLVVVQLAVGQFSPRIVRTILYDRPSQITMGVFAASFAHAMLAMREIGSADEGAPVPGLAILVAFGLVILSIIVLILYVNHIGQSLRAAALIDSVGDEMREIVDKLYPVPGTERRTIDTPVIEATKSGVLFHIDYGELVRAATEASCTLTLRPMIGDFVPAGGPLFDVDKESAALDIARVLDAVALGPERTLNQDVAYGFRMLVDIAERNLADPFDPTTAVQAIDRLHDCLRQLAPRAFPSSDYLDEEGYIRLRVRHITWEGYVRLAFDEIRQTGASSAQVVRRIRAALEDLLTVAPPERRAPLEVQLQLLQAAIAENAWPAAERSQLFDDAQGIGSGVDLGKQETPVQPHSKVQ